MFARRIHTQQPTRNKQGGAVLLIMMVVMVLGALTFLVSSLKSSGLRIEQNQNSSQILARAKEVVLGYATGSSNSLGTLFMADRLISPIEVTNGVNGSPNYDGDMDSCQSFDVCLGRLPWKSYGMSINTPFENDPMGIMPWYSISGNMYAADVPIFNSDILSAAPHPWLTVRDMNGNILSNRAAIVLFLPGNPLANQSRPLSPNLGGVNQYLDSITVPATCTAPCVPGTYSNSDLDDDYIMGDEHRWVTAPNNNTKKIEDSSYKFNDKLIYVTIDELMPLIEKRVGGEIKKTLNTYFAAWGHFPYATPFGDPSISNYTGQTLMNAGLLPIGNNVMPTWTAAPAVANTGGGILPDCELVDGAANNSRWRCGDTNAHGYDPLDPRSFISIPAGKTITFTGTLRDVGRGLWRPHNINDTTEVRVRDIGNNTVLASTVLDNVTILNSLNQDSSANILFSATGKAGVAVTKLRRIELRDIKNYSSPILPALTIPVTPTPPAIIPAWLQANNWHQFAYYEVAQGYSPGRGKTCALPCLRVNGQGGGSNIQAVVVMSSNRLANQIPLLSDTLGRYFEGQNTFPADFIYENQNPSGTFNDQVITVAP
jgi:hypothetical protein